jgi:AcrR family transcriptional regulator
VTRRRARHRLTAAAGHTERRARRRLTPAVRRAELIDAAFRVLKQHGSVASRVEDVTTAAGAAKGTFYLYFPSWDDLLVAVRDRILDEYATAVRARFAEPRRVNWWALLAAECGCFVDFVLELGALHDAIFHGPIADRPIDDARSATRLIAETLRGGIAAGAFAPVDIEPSAQLFFAVLHTSADAIAQGGDRGRFLQALQQLLHRWLDPGAAGRTHPGQSPR